MPGESERFFSPALGLSDPPSILRRQERNMSRGDGLARQLQLMQMLEHRQEIVVPEVAAQLGYTVRTVYRDLQVLERVGVPIYQERRGQKARWRVMEGYRRRLSITLSW